MRTPRNEAEVLDIKNTRKRWNHFLTLMKRRWLDPCGLRLHEFHGLHVHLITNRFVHVNECRPMAIKAGWGRVHVQRVSEEQAQYPAKYLSREREPCFKRWRLWGAFGDWERVLVKDIELDTPRAKIYRLCKTVLGWEGNHHFNERMQTVEALYRETF